MIARLLGLLLVAAFCACSGQAWPASANLAIPVMAASTFTALHTYYLSPSGSDASSGLSPSTAWATPNHAVNCGDVIIAAPGAYNTAWSSWGAVSNCPSTSGGIDGTGGVYFAVLLCGGSDLGANGCSKSLSSGPGMRINASNWAVEGWTINGNGAYRAYEVNACASGTTVVHHVAFVNDVAYNATQGFDTNDGGMNHNVPGNGGDYFAVVGSVAQNAAQDSICLAAIDSVGPANSDTNAGTHVFLDGNFVIANNTTPNSCSYDEEGIMFDTWDAHGYQGTGIASNNLVWASTRYGVQIFDQRYHTAAATLKVYNNTFYDDLKSTGSDSADGEINLNCAASGGSCGNSNWTLSITANIAQNTNATSAGGKPIYAAVWGGQLWSLLTNNGNLLKGAATTCGGTCDSTKSAVAYNGNSLGSQTYSNPGFANASDLLTNWVGVPTLTGFATTVQAMGWNAATSTLTPNTPIADLAPSSSYSAYGYQRPSTTCAANSDYPTWLKGVVYLSWNSGSRTITEAPGLVTKPCGL